MEVRLKKSASNQNLGLLTFGDEKNYAQLHEAHTKMYDDLKKSGKALHLVEQK